LCNGDAGDREQPTDTEPHGEMWQGPNRNLL
jgi:hypothetical protein